MWDTNFCINSYLVIIIYTSIILVELLPASSKRKIWNRKLDSGGIILGQKCLFWLTNDPFWDFEKIPKDFDNRTDQSHKQTYYLEMSYCGNISNLLVIFWSQISQYKTLTFQALLAIPTFSNVITWQEMGGCVCILWFFGWLYSLIRTFQEYVYILITETF